MAKRQLDDGDTNGILFGDLEKAWFDNEEAFFNTKPPTTLYHYTSAGGLNGIFRSKGMYASPSFAMNDPSELVFGLEIIEKVCRDIKKNGAYSKEEVAIADALLKEPSVIEKKYGKNFPTLLLISFSEKFDNLSQWRCYANDGHGFAVGISTPAIDFDNPAGTTGLIGRWRFYQCIYDESRQKTCVHSFISAFAGILQRAGVILSQYVLAKYSIYYLWDMASTFKHPAYVDEAEWRVRMAILPGQQVTSNEYSSYISGPALRASKHINFMGHKPIDSVWIGPRNNFESAEFALDILIKESNMPLTIGIHRSRAPYR